MVSRLGTIQPCSEPYQLRPGYSNKVAKCFSKQVSCYTGTSSCGFAGNRSTLHLWRSTFRYNEGL